MRSRSLCAVVVLVLAGVAVLHTVSAIASAAPNPCCVRTAEHRSACCKAKRAAAIESPRGDCCAEAGLVETSSAVRVSVDPILAAPFIVLAVVERIGLPTQFHVAAALPCSIDRPPRPRAPTKNVVILS